MYENEQNENRLSPDELQQKEKAEKLALAYGQIFNTPAGKFVLADLRERCNAENCGVRNALHPDPYSVMFEAGKNAVYNFIMVYLKADNERRKRQR